MRIYIYIYVCVCVYIYIYIYIYIYNKKLYKMPLSRSTKLNDQKWSFLGDCFIAYRNRNCFVYICIYVHVHVT